ncbi:MAG TPA: WecB/TagA/CpsF family glycosyltransferase [Patescibacteria group bacterium]|nr:WecB/TagA/CpsF family glycosyltransferase [Patescibacteria group bacterium]
MRTRCDILGVYIDAVTLQESLAMIARFLSDRSSRKYMVVTPNPEFLVTARSDKDFRFILNKADLAIPDGVGIVLAARLMGYEMKERVAGVDLVEGVCKYCEENGLRVMFFGGRGNVAEKTYECLIGTYSKLSGTFLPGPNDIGHLTNEEKNYLLTSLSESKPDVLFIAFGAPRQEKWIYQNLREIPAKVTIGVGGAFDMISGKVSRAPVVLRKLGFEWLWRLVQEPWRWKRQLRLLRFVALVSVFWLRRTFISFLASK